ncbi:MAG: NUDIX domain-containing protein [Opitutales bacterium]|nr:NUDIX domain-containing protein [Opitutales bacterium]
MDEWFDLVDENDLVIGRERRSIVHAQNLLHRAVHILIFNDAGEIFLQKRSLLKDQYPGLWSTSCAGHLDSGEGYRKAALRELYEELRVTTDQLHERLYLEACPETGYEFLRVYTCKHNGPFVLNRDEIDKGQWFSIEALNRFIETEPQQLTPPLIYIWNHYRKQYLKK